MPDEQNTSNIDALRPRSLQEFTGQPNTVGELDIILSAARERGHLPDHMLFAGPPGLGKTSLSHIVASECGASFVASSGPAIEKASVLAQMLSTMSGPTVVFIDEIHRLPIHVEEILYSAMEDKVLDLHVGERASARVVRLPLRDFCLVGATTQVGMVSAPLRSRFGFTARLQPYDVDTLAKIVERSSRLMGLTIDETAAREIASRSQGTPRVANRWLRRVRDWAQTRPERDREAPLHITAQSAVDALDRFGVDKAGLDRTSRDLLELLCVGFQGGPVGLTTLAAALGDTPDTISDVLEPHLMRRSFIARTPRGRVATAAGYMHLGLEPPPGLVVTELATDEQM